MKDVMKKVLEHPWGSAFLIGAVSDGIVKIIRAVKTNAVASAVNNVTTNTTK